MSTIEIAETVKTTFSRQTTVSTDIQADASVIWALLTTADDYTRWNSTVTLLEGKIALDETIKLKSILDAKRTFKLKVKEMEVNKKLAWGDAQGTRVYTLDQKTNGLVTFTMREKIGGLLFPLFAKMIPPFDESFERFAADLKHEAELIMQSK
ncbi:MAG: SRPBCC domain-containing protein [Saprospiraceae bacterium]|nr:SRPBCC domain-containing protein [Saprospiraceae bacterium]MBK8779914.1 SRPBCC domain-containing protein [Saprospiraceae bacterium]MBP7803538.1 SRPBCC domain-containing protein [Saprospiraceae bacterium]MBP8096726.1 SRPBCC domain-containing protein [Saprospiraceae bacterium]